jgi:hypothetical protein
MERFLSGLFRAPAAPRSEKQEELEKVLDSGTSFPGIPLHVCMEDITLQEIDKVKVSFPVHIRNVSLIKVRRCSM